MTIYGIALLVHGWLRWGVVALLVVLVAKTFAGWRGKRAWTSSDERAHVALIAVTDVQLGVGFWMYLLASPISTAFLADPKAAMSDSVLRFFGLEHITMMAIGITLLHVGRARSKKSEQRHRTAFGWTVAATLFILVAIPWPFLKHGRPLARVSFDTGDPVEACPPTFEERCVACHGATGRGNGVAAANLDPGPRDFSDEAWIDQRSDAQLGAVIREGGIPHDLSAAMPANPDLSNDEVAALVSCVRSFSR